MAIRSMPPFFLGLVAGLAAGVSSSSQSSSRTGFLPFGLGSGGASSSSQSEARAGGGLDGVDFVLGPALGLAAPGVGGPGAIAGTTPDSAGTGTAAPHLGHLIFLPISFGLLVLSA